MKNNLEILYEDNHIIVALKPINILSQSDRTNDVDMLTLLKNYIKEKYKKEGNVYLGLVHRLDRPTGGIMIFARTSKAARRLSESIKKGEVNKTYLTIVENFKENNGVYEDYLIKSENGNSKVTTKELGKYAKLEFKKLMEIDNFSLLEVNLVTGRHHQIRVQFQSRGYPLYGDNRYGIESKKQLALFAYKLEFIHPVTKEKMIFKKYPSYSKFNLFKEYFYEK